MSKKGSKVALITGASRGIGRAICLSLAKNGFDIAVNYNSSKKEAEETVLLIKKLNQDAISYKADITKRQNMKNLLNEIIKTFGRIDVLVNNAGFLDQKPFENITDENWKNIFDINLNSCFIGIQEVSKVIRDNGSIVNISSIGAQMGGTKAIHYAAAKGAMLTLTRSTAKHLAKRGIRVNAVAPGFIRTEMFNQILDRNGFEEESISETIPLKRIGQPEDVASAISFLVSDEASYITGHTLNINGGLWI